MRRKVTIGDVARAAGVSVSTVDRVLNGRGGVDQEKEASVLHWARRLGLDRNLEVRPTRLLRIGILMSEASNLFYKSLHEAVARANRIFQANSIRCFVHHVDVLSPERSAARITSAAAEHDALIVVCPEEPRIAAAVAEAASAVPVVTLVSDLPRTGRLTYVGMDNRAAGRVAGELMGKFLGPGGGEVVVVSGLHSFIGHEEREMGFRAVLQERFPACRLVAVVETRERQEKAGALVRELFQRHPGIAGVYNVSTGNRAIAEALARLDLGRHVTFITHELTPERRALLKEGVIDAIIDQNPELQIATAVELIARHFGRRDTPPTTGITPLNIHLRENS
jgi:LacI family transcriptional regulator